MNVYFTGSPRALKHYKTEHQTIYRTIEQLGHIHLSDVMVRAEPETYYDATHEQIVEMYNETMQSLRQAEVLIAEISAPSVSKGFLINKALEQNKPVIGLHLHEHQPFFLSAISHEKLQLLEYSTDNIQQVLSEAFAYVQTSSTVRFNFFLSPPQISFLDWIAAQKRIPRAEYLRGLIDKDMKECGEYREAK